MLKATSLVSILAISDLLYSVEGIYGRTFQTIPLLIVACFWYLVASAFLPPFKTPWSVAWGAVIPDSGTY